VQEGLTLATHGAIPGVLVAEWISNMQEELTVQEQREVHTCHLSYFSRMTDAVSFGDVGQVEMHRRGVSQAKAVCAVADGAD
jgi:hypothetical protein